jgi:hypothetical protein
MENLIGKGSDQAKELLGRADKLEAVMCLLHGSAYVPVRQAVRVFRRLAQETTFPQVVPPDALRELIAELRKFSGTVSRPSSDRMTSAALTLERLL